VCVRNYNSNPKNKDTITVDYTVIGGKQLLTEGNKTKSINIVEVTKIWRFSLHHGDYYFNRVSPDGLRGRSMEAMFSSSDF